MRRSRPPSASRRRYSSRTGASSDEEEPEFDGERVRLIPEVRESFEAFAAAGLLAAAQDYDYGGMQLPVVVDKACFAYFLAANVGSSGYPLLTAANANLLLAHGIAGTDRRIRAAACSPAATPAPCACPSRRPVRRSRTSPRGPSPTATRRSGRATG